MEIFNIHLFELLLIAGLALVVFGPERLPEVGRFAGKQVARFLAWQQQSPELQMINDVRAEFEQEIASLRDELVRTRKELDISKDVTQNLNSIRDELRPMLNLRDKGATPKGSATAIAAQQNGTPAPDSASPPAPAEAQPAAELADGLAELPDPPTPVPDLAPAEETTLVEQLLDPVDAVADPLAAPAELTTDPRPAPQGTVQAAAHPNRLAATEPTNVFERRDQRLDILEARRRSLHDAPEPDDSPHAGAAGNGQLPEAVETAATAQGEPQLTAATVALLVRQLESLSADVQTLISGLQAQGVLGADWQPEAAIAEQEELSS